MNFTATAVIKEIEKLNEKFFKILLEDERRQHIVVNVPVEKEKDLAIGNKVSIWGNVSAFNYQSKWYNNLFAQTVVPEEKKYILIKKIEESGKEVLKKIQYGSNPFTLEFIQINFPKDCILKKENLNENEELEDIILHEIIRLEKEEIVYDNLIEKNQIRDRSLLKTLECNFNFGFYNLEYWHLQNAISQNKIYIKGDKIFNNENFAYFSKLNGLSNLPLIYFTEEKL